MDNAHIKDSIIYGLDEMESFPWGDGSIAILQFSQFIRLELWTEKTAFLLNKVLKILNAVYSLIYKDMPFTDCELVNVYIKQFKRPVGHLSTFLPYYRGME